MLEYFYRYRPIKAVLDEFHELENGEIYFSTPDELNDPMEGFKDLFWQGDEIVWRNLLKHYILCVQQTASYCFLARDDFDPNILKSIVFWVPQELPDAPIRGLYERVSTAFLAEPPVQKLIKTLGARTTPVRRSELKAYLRALHGFALQIVIKEYQEQGVLAPPKEGPRPPSAEKLRRDAIAVIEGVTQIRSAEHPPEQVTEALFTASDATNDQVLLINEYNMPGRDHQKPIVFLANRFAGAYVAALDKLVHWDWYVACFAKTPEDHSMWSTYAGGHRGVCLMFKAKKNVKGVPSLPLERITGAGGSVGKPMVYHRNFVSQEFSQVGYSGRYPSIDFFRSLGRIKEIHMNNFWYRSEDGTFSICRDAVYADSTAWREAYWQTFTQSALCKTPEWAHEEEYRIVVHSMMFDMTEKKERKLKYSFDDLGGIVFGARTDWEDKLKIMRIVDKKCALAKRGDFKFFEVRYLHTESRFQLFELGLLTPKYSS